MYVEDQHRKPNATALAEKHNVLATFLDMSPGRKGYLLWSDLKMSILMLMNIKELTLCNMDKEHCAEMYATAYRTMLSDLVRLKRVLTEKAKSKMVHSTVEVLERLFNLIISPHATKSEASSTVSSDAESVHTIDYEEQTVDLLTDIETNGCMF